MPAQRHGKPDASKWREAPSVTGRPADTPPANTTMAQRRAARLGTGAPTAHVAEVGGDSAGQPEPEKTPAKKAAARKG